MMATLGVINMRFSRKTNLPLVTYLVLNEQVISLACKVSHNNQLLLAKWLQIEAWPVACIYNSCPWTVVRAH